MNRTDIPIRFDLHDRTAVLTLRRPEHSNALSLELLGLFTRFLDEIRENARCHILLLKAEGKNFCGGLDLKEAARSHENARTMPFLVVEILAKLRRLPQMVVTVAHGAARAGGGGLVAASDYVVASEDFNIAFPEVRRGLQPVLLFPLLRRRLSSSALGELLLSGQAVDASRAHQLGLVHKVVETGQENAAAEYLVSEFFRADPASVRAAKEMIVRQENAWAKCSLEEELEEGLERHLASWFSPAGREGVAAFLEKREPRWE